MPAKFNKDTVSGRIYSMAAKAHEPDLSVAAEFSTSQFVVWLLMKEDKATNENRILKAIQENVVHWRHRNIHELMVELLVADIVTTAKGGYVLTAGMKDLIEQVKPAA